MSSSYWTSSQRNQWKVEKWQIAESRKEDGRWISDRDITWLHFFYVGLISQLGKKLGLRQQVIATAIVYWKRYYLKNPLKSTDPLLVIATAIFVASKIEECPIHLKSVVDNFRSILQHQVLSNLGCSVAYRDVDGPDVSEPVQLLQTSNSTPPSYLEPSSVNNSATGISVPVSNHPSPITNTSSHPSDAFPYDPATVAEFEFYLLEEMEFYLVLHHPYKSLIQFVQELGLEKTVLGPAWYVVNDAYKTHLPLLQPPHIISLAAIYVVGALHEELLVPEADEHVATPNKVDLATWFGKLDVDMETVVSVASDILLLYQELDLYQEKKIPEILERLRPGRMRGSEITKLVNRYPQLK